MTNDRVRGCLGCYKKHIGSASMAKACKHHCHKSLSHDSRGVSNPPARPKGNTPMDRTYHQALRLAFLLARLRIYIVPEQDPRGVTPLRVAWRGDTATTPNLQPARKV
jgi:hypothetical protein